MATTPGRRQPTINDLRVKMCYICREEEAHDQLVTPPRKWVHPCKCTLIAHESCLLEWIRSAEQNPRKKEDQVLKCPQCGSKYEMISEQTLALRILEGANKVLSIGGRIVTICTIGSLVIAFSGGVFVLLSGFGAVAVRQFAGEELYQCLLTDDPTNWPMLAWINLPLIPLSLILSRSSLPGRSSIMQLFMTWPMLSPQIQQTSVSSVFSRIVARNLVDLDSLEPTFQDVLFSWPPSPLVYSVGFSIIRGIYSNYYRKLRRRILGESVTSNEQGRNAQGVGVRQLLIENWQMEVRVDADDDIEAEANIVAQPPLPLIEDARERERRREAEVRAANAIAPAEQLDGANHEPAQPQPVEEPIEPAPADDAIPRPEHRADEPELDVPGAPAPDFGPANAFAEAAANHPLDPEVPAGEAAPAPVPVPVPAPAPAPVPAPVAPLRPNEPENPNMRPRNANVRLTGSVLGRIIGGGLITPFISSRIGNLLLSLSRHSVLLRRFLGVRPAGEAVLVAALGMHAYDKTFSELSNPNTSVLRSTWLAARFGVCFAAAGSAVWRKADPVWWRSTIGLGIFVVTRDAISLYYEWLSQREIRSRTLRDRSFEGIDPAELDLIPERRSEFT